MHNAEILCKLSKIKRLSCQVQEKNEGNQI